MSTAIEYRPEIDGLRTLAVVSVVIFHAKFLLSNKEIFLPGGFLGVDVFFVISGYLITLIILRELHKDRFSFSNFYKRRARRILPALFIVLLVCIPFSWHLLLPQEMVEFGSSVLSTLFFYSNFQFWFEDPYWATTGELKPLLHTWSLAVEEQYYFLVPLLLVALHTFWKRGILFVSFALLFISLCLAIYYTPENPRDTFYLLPFRLWELMVGGVLAAAELRFGRPKFTRLSSVFTSLGLLGLLCSFVVFDEFDLHPHWITLVPIFSAAAIIWFARSEDYVTRLLSTKVFVGIGLISYSLYLWHYPIFSFATASELQFGWVAKIGLIFLSIILAIVSYFLVEQPFRQKMTRGIALISIVVAVAVVVSASTFGKLARDTEGFKSRLPNVIDLYGDNEPDKDLLVAKVRNYYWLNNYPYKDPNKTNVLILGDSHGRDIFNALSLNKSAFKNTEFYRLHTFNLTPNLRKECVVDSPKDMDDFFESADFILADIVLLSDFFTRDTHVVCLDKFLMKMAKSDKKIILFDTQSFNRANTKKMNVKTELNGLEEIFLKRRKPNFTAADYSILMPQKYPRDEIDKIKYSQIKSQSVAINSKIQALADKHDVKFINKYSYLCDSVEQTCTVFTKDNKKIYYDQSHLTLDGAKLIGQRLLTLDVLN